MDLKAGMTLIPPTVKNSSCTHPRYSSAAGSGTSGGGGVGGTGAGAGNYSFLYHIGFMETIEAILILILTLGVIGANAMIIFVINNRRYTPYIPQQPRYLLTSLALNDLAIGLLITPFGLIPALFKCWPYGEIFCQIQALLRGALSQQSAVILICMAIDRYMCALHPRRYQQHSSKKGCVAILSLTWIINLTVFGLLVLPKGYYFNNTGLMACEPFYSKPSYRILATCALYFPTTMVLMYCYGLSFHLSRFRLITEPIQQSGTTISSQTSLNATIKKITLEERHLSASTSRSMAAISLGFIVMVTPWTIQEIVTACTGSKLPRFLDFLVTWTALSNSFWNPFIYWVLNSHFRRLSKFLLSIQWCPHEEVPRHKGHCCNINSECDPLSTLPFPPPPHPPHSYSIRHSTGNDIDGNDSVIGDGGVSSRRGDGGGGGTGHGTGAGGIAPYYLTSIRPDIEGLSEKYWGEILERTLSSGSLYALQKTFSSSQEQQKQQREQTQSHHQHHSQHQQQHHQQYDYQQHEPHRHHHRYSSHAHQQHQHQHQQQQQQQQQQQSIHFNKNSDLIATITGQCEQHCNDVDNDATNGNRVINLSDCEDDDDDEDDDENDEDEDVNELQDQQQQQQQQQQLHQHQHQHQKHQGRFNINDFSSSELKLCEHIYHDVNCAKNKAAAAAAAAAAM